MSNNRKLPFYTQGMPTIKFRQIFVKKKKKRKRHTDTKQVSVFVVLAQK